MTTPPLSERVSQNDPSLATARSLYLSTEDLPEKDRLAIWHEVHGKSLFNLGVAPHPETTFHAKARINRFNDILLTTEETSCAKYYVDRSHLQNAHDSVSIFTVLSGKIHGHQLGRDVVVGPGGSFAILNSETAFVDVLEAGISQLIYVPRFLIDHLVSDMERYLMQPSALDRNALQLLTSYGSVLQENFDRIDEQLCRGIAEHLADLTAGALGATGDAKALIAERSLRNARLQAIKTDIATHLTDHELSAEVVARRQGVSSRYVRKLLDGEGVSFSDLVLKMRLASAYDLICDQVQQKRPIASIAYEVGFSDLSYFNRTFRRQFGMTPTDARAQRAEKQVSS